jgi:hypothetical protein
MSYKLKINELVLKINELRLNGEEFTVGLLFAWLTTKTAYLLKPTVKKISTATQL